MSCARCPRSGARFGIRSPMQNYRTDLAPQLEREEAAFGRTALGSAVTSPGGRAPTAGRDGNSAWAKLPRTSCETSTHSAGRHWRYPSSRSSLARLGGFLVGGGRLLTPATNDAWRAHSAACSCSSALRMASRPRVESSSRMYVLSISGPSVLIVNFTPFRRNVSKIQRNSSQPLTTRVFRLLVG